MDSKKKIFSGSCNKNAGNPEDIPRISGTYPKINQRHISVIIYYSELESRGKFGFHKGVPLP